MRFWPWTKSRLTLTVCCVAAGIASAAETNLNHRVGSLPKDEVQAVYADDPHDAWNRIFHCLFTRTLKIQLTDDFPEGAPFTNRADVHRKQVSTRLFERIEGGDRAVEPLYPHEHFRDDVSTAQLLAEPRFSEFKAALTEALAERSSRPPLERALMQSDVWAAYDFVVKDVSGWILKGAPIPLFNERQARLRELLAKFIKQLALTPAEIKGLPDNYAHATADKSLPNLFGTDSGWLEVLGTPEREHERAAQHRRVTRVFVKPRKMPADKAQFLRDAGDDDIHKQIVAAALMIQNLLVDSTGKVVPSPLTCEVQIRTFAKKGEQPRFEQYELSRRALLKNPRAGGLSDFSGGPAYLPGAGNDYSFAPPLDGGHPTAVSLASRCIACHNADGTQFFTFARSTPVRMLAPARNEHGQAVAGLKMKQASFQKLSAAWR